MPAKVHRIFETARRKPAAVIFLILFLVST
jgi:hypothetical protein